MASKSSSIAAMLIGGLGLCGLQVYHLLTAGPGANYGMLIGGLVGCAVGTAIGLAFVLWKR